MGDHPVPSSHSLLPMLCGSCWTKPKLLLTCQNKNRYLIMDGWLITVLQYYSITVQYSLFMDMSLGLFSSCKYCTYLSMIYDRRHARKRSGTTVSKRSKYENMKTEPQNHRQWYTYIHYSTGCLFESFVILELTSFGDNNIDRSR